MINITILEPISNQVIANLSIDMDIQQMDLENPKELQILGESIAGAIANEMLSNDNDNDNDFHPYSSTVYDDDDDDNEEDDYECV